MIKKEYIQPAMNVVKFQQTHMLCVSEVTTTGLDKDEDLDYEGNSDDMSGAYVKGSSYSVWDDDWSK